MDDTSFVEKGVCQPATYSYRLRRCVHSLLSNENTKPLNLRFWKYEIKHRPTSTAQKLMISSSQFPKMMRFIEPAFYDQRT